LIAVDEAAALAGRLRDLRRTNVAPIRGRSRRSYAATVIVTAIALVLTLASRGDGAPPCPGVLAWSFAASTSGLPAATVHGRWECADDEPRLVVQGGHSQAERSTFNARLLTRATPAGATPYFETTYEYVTAGTRYLVDLRSKFRYRERGGEWSRWLRSRVDWTDEATGAGGDFRFWGPPSRHQFEWRIRGVITGDTLLEGTHSFEIHD
jgi:hypothetical protein